MIFTDTSQFLWRPTGVTDREILDEWPYVFQNMLTRPVSTKYTEGLLLKSRQDFPDMPLIMSITDRMLHHITSYRAVLVLQARIRRFHQKHEKVVAVLGATHSRLGSKSLLGSMLDADMLQIIVQRL